MIHANPSTSDPSRRVLVIMGSVRQGRHCATLSSWVTQIARTHTSADLVYELVDLKDWPLPMDDEPGIPAQGVYDQPHTQAWSEKIKSADGFVFVTPQYNWGYPAPLKNALDHVYKEWHEKPAVIVSYGGHGGSKCAAQLAQVLEGLGMRPVPTQPQITLTRFMIGGGPIDADIDFDGSRGMVAQAFVDLQTALFG